MIAGERTIVRHTGPPDLELLTGWFEDPEIFLAWGGRPLSREEVRTRYLGSRRPKVVSFVIETREPEQDGTPIGYIQYWQDVPGTGGLDMFLLPHARGRGLGPDAATALVRYLFEERDWVSVVVDPACDNIPAIKAWMKAGFVPTRRDVDKYGTDVLVMEARRDRSQGAAVT